MRASISACSATENEIRQYREGDAEYDSRSYTGMLTDAGSIPAAPNINRLLSRFFYV